MASAFDGASQLALFALGQAGLFARFYLPVLVDVALQGLKILVVKVSYVSPVFKNLRHKNPPSSDLGYRLEVVGYSYKLL